MIFLGWYTPENTSVTKLRNALEFAFPQGTNTTKMLKYCQVPLVLGFLLYSGPIVAQQGPTELNPTDFSKNSEIGSLLAQAKSEALKIQRDFDRGQILNQIGAVQAESGDIAAALDTAKEAYPFGTEIMSAIGDRLASSDHPEKWEVAIQKSNAAGSSTIYYAKTEKLLAIGEMDAAQAAARQILSPEVRSEALRLVAQKQALLGREDLARSILREAKPPEQSSSDVLGNLSIFLRAEIERGDLDQAKRTLEGVASPQDRAMLMMEAVGVLIEKKKNKIASAWLDNAFTLPIDEDEKDTFHYFAIPFEVKLGETHRAIQAAAGLSSADQRIKGYVAVAVSCAEDHDLDCVTAAVNGIRGTAALGTKERDLEEFVADLGLLDIAASLVESEELSDAETILNNIHQEDDYSFQTMIKPEIQMLRATILARQKRFAEARAQAAEIRPQASVEDSRRNALRLVAFWSTKEEGASSSRTFAEQFSDAADKAYALLGICQAMVGKNAGHLPYSAIDVH